MFQAIGATTVVKIIYPKKQSLLIIPQTAVKFQKYDGQIRYEVESVGPKSIWRNDIKKGDFISIQRHEGKPFLYEGQEYRRVADRWVMGKEG